MQLYLSISQARVLRPADRRLWRALLPLALLLVVPFHAGCRNQQPAHDSYSAMMSVSSTSLRDGTVPKEFTCDGEDRSPSISWTAPPRGTKSLALSVTDPDAPGGIFTHWLIFNVPADIGSFPVSQPKQDRLADGSRQGMNDFGKTGYGGPCPPPGSSHRYVFTIYALDRGLDLQPGATRQEFEAAARGHVLATGRMTAGYAR